MRPDCKCTIHSWGLYMQYDSLLQGCSKLLCMTLTYPTCTWPMTQPHLAMEAWHRAAAQEQCCQVCLQQGTILNFNELSSNPQMCRGLSAASWGQLGFLSHEQPNSTPVQAPSPCRHSQITHEQDSGPGCQRISPMCIALNPKLASRFRPSPECGQQPVPCIGSAS